MSYVSQKQASSVFAIQKPSVTTTIGEGLASTTLIVSSQADNLIGQIYWDSGKYWDASNIWDGYGQYVSSNKAISSYVGEKQSG